MPIMGWREEQDLTKRGIIGGMPKQVPSVRNQISDPKLGQKSKNGEVYMYAPHVVIGGVGDGQCLLLTGPMRK